MEKLNGIVLCGGESKRMGIDKGLLEYNNLPQRLHTYHLLATFCTSVYICCNEEQSKSLEANNNFILDQEELKNKGPLTGILSAQKQLPQKHFLVLGCDYPLIKKEDIEPLIEAFSKNQCSTFYINESNFIEPLIGIYNSKDLLDLSVNNHQHNDSLQSFLKTKNINRSIPSNPERLRSFDYFEDWKNFKNS